MVQQDAVAYVQLFGEPCARVGSRHIPFAPEKRFQLLAYLAFHGDWISRERIAYLFWPDTDTSTSLANLRQLLHRMRSLHWTKSLEATPHALRWRVETDVAVFQTAYAQGDNETALLVAEGRFLSGLENEACAEFGSWLDVERQRLEVCWREVAFRSAAMLSRSGHHEEAAQLFHKLLKRDELDEEALRGYLGASFRAGKRAHALRAYWDFSDRLRDELGIEPSSATERVAAVILKHDHPPEPLATSRALSHEPVATRSHSDEAAPRPRLPLTASPLVGRASELAEVLHLLALPDCRLLTLAGPGGVGKTRLAVQVAHDLAGRYPKGLAFVSLESLSSAEGIFATIAQALNVRLQGEQSPLGGVATHLAGRRSLIILDNFEHLLDAAASLPELLERCPQLTLLVTSRERLNLKEEWWLPLGGLSYPDTSKSDVANALAYDAPRLFLERVQRVRPEIVLPTDLAGVARICRALDGLPLGLELAAAWVKMLSYADIAQELEDGIDILATKARDVPQRQRSIRATLDYSWNLLAPVEQRALRELAVFRGGFQRQAAKEVAEVTLPVLANLVDKSLLRVSPAGRYGYHPLIHMYACERLADSAAESQPTRKLAQRHAVYYLKFLASWRETIHGPKRQEALAVIEDELENVRLAWRRATTEGLWPLLQQALEAMVFFHGSTGRFQEGRDALAETADALKAHEDERAALLGNVLASQAWFCSNLGLFREAERLAQASLPPLKAANDTVGMLRAHSYLGTLATRTGLYARAEEHLRASLSLARRSGLPNEIGRILGFLGALEVATGNYAAAQLHYAEALTLNERLGNHAGVVNALDSLGRLKIIFGQADDARKHLERGLSLAETVGFEQRTPYLLINLARAHHELGQEKEAHDAALKALRLSQERDQQALVAEAMLLVGHLAPDEETASRYLRQGLVLASSIGDMPRTMLAVIRIAERWCRSSRSARAFDLLTFARAHPATRHEDRVRSSELLATFSEEASHAGLGARSACEEAKVDTLLGDILLEL